MKKILVLILLILSVAAIVSCGDSEDASSTFEFDTTLEVVEKTVTVTYEATTGGTIVGEAVQSATITKPSYFFSEVTAVADEGYVFKGWSDGKLEPTRRDILSADRTYTANFKKLLTVSFTAGPGGWIRGNLVQEVAEGESNFPVTAIANPGYKFVGWSNGNKGTILRLYPTVDGENTATAIFEPVTLSMPVINITTENYDPIQSKEFYVNCSVDVFNTDDKYTLTAEGGKIKGRGNTSWKNDKKPYHLKFNEAVDLFGNGAARTWNLIPNHTDYSMIRNYLAYSAAAKMDTLGGMGEMQFVELYLNGSYDGVYLICEQIEPDENRVQMETAKGVLDCGYIIELDGHSEGDRFVINNTYYTIHTPKNYSKEQKNYIGYYVIDCLDAINSGDWSRVTALIDVESYAESYIIHEIHKCCDVGYSSFYMIKDAGGKLRCGPVWDFDRSLGNVYNKAGSMDPEALFASYENQWFKGLLEYEQFTRIVCEKMEYYAPILKKTYEDCFSYVLQYQDSFERNNERWDILGKDLYPNPSTLVRIRTWKGQVDYAKEFLYKSLDYMIKTYKPEE